MDNERGTHFVNAWSKCLIRHYRPSETIESFNQSFGTRGVAVKWFESYLANRTQTAKIGLCTSTHVTLKYGASLSNETVISRLGACIKDIKIRMTDNPLKLTGEQTKLIVITTDRKTNHSQHTVVNILGPLIAPSGEPRRKVLFDATHRVNDHVYDICKSINYNLYSTRKF